jgi:hypothetical protein
VIQIEVPEAALREAATRAVMNAIRPSSGWNDNGGTAYQLIAKQVADQLKELDFQPYIEEALDRLLAPTVEELVKAEIEKQVKKAIKEAKIGNAHSS